MVQPSRHEQPSHEISDATGLKKRSHRPWPHVSSAARKSEHVAHGMCSLQDVTGSGRCAGQPMASALYNLLLNNAKYAGAAPGPAG